MTVFLISAPQENLGAVQSDGASHSGARLRLCSYATQEQRAAEHIDTWTI